MTGQHASAGSGSACWVGSGTQTVTVNGYELFGEIPYCNSHGSKMKRTDEFSYFTESRIATILEDSG